MAQLGKLTVITAYDADNTDYPILGILCDPRAPGYQVPPDLDPHPDDITWPDHVFHSSVPAQNDGRVQHLYSIFPGPWSTSTRQDYDGETLTTKSRRNIAGNITTQETLVSTFWTRTYRQQQNDDLICTEIQEFRTVPGNYVPTTRYDLVFGPISGCRRLVANSGLTTTLTATLKRTYQAYENSDLVVWELIETNSDGSGSNPAYPIRSDNFYEKNERGAVDQESQLVADISSAGSMAVVSTTVTEIRYKAIDQFHRDKITEVWTIPGPILTGEPKIDDDGATITTTRNLDIASAITEGEIVSANVWTMTTSDAYSGDTGGTLRWKNTEARILNAGSGTPGPTVSPIIREDRWNDQYNTIMATFRQYVPEGATKQIIGAAYSTADTYVTDSITALTVSDPGSGYTTIPTLTVSASPGGGTLATATVTNLQAVSATVSAPGAAVTLGTTTFTVSGGTGTAAVVTVTGGTLSTLLLNAPGTGQAVGDVIGLQGGVYSKQGAITWTAVQAVVAPTVVAAGTAMVAGTTVLTLAGGTGTNPTATVTHTKVNATGFAVVAAGTGDLSDTAGVIVEGSDGTGTKFRASVTIFAYQIVSVQSITVAGDYTANPTIAAAPVIFISTPGTGTVLTGATLSVVMGALTVSLTTGGTLTAVATTYTSTGGGNNATFTISSYGGKTFTISNPGEYSAPETAAFTQASTSGTGINATFQTATYVPSVLTVTTGGAYTAIPTSPVSFTAGSMTAILDFGVGTVALGTAGTKYYYPPTITPSYGTALILPTMSSPIIQIGTLTGYVVDTGLINTEHSKMKRLVWSTMYIPPSRIERATKQFPLPNVFTWLSNWDLHPPSTLTKKGPFPGVNFTIPEV